MISTAGRLAISGVVLTLALGLLTACGPTPAGSGGLVGRMTATSDVANLPGGQPVSGGGLAILPIDVMDGPFWELTGAEPVAATCLGRAGRSTASIGAQVVDGLHVHAEVLGKLARGQHGLEAEPRKAFAVHETKVFEANPTRSSYGRPP